MNNNVVKVQERENTYIIYSNNREYSIQFVPKQESEPYHLYIGGVEVEIPKKNILPFIGFDHIFDINGKKYRCVLMRNEFDVVAEGKYVRKNSDYIPMKVVIGNIVYVSICAILLAVLTRVDVDVYWWGIPILLLSLDKCIVNYFIKKARNI